MNEAKQSKIPRAHCYSYIYERSPFQEYRGGVDWSAPFFGLFFFPTRREERQSKLLGFWAGLGRSSLMRFVCALASQTSQSQSQSEAVSYWNGSLFLLSSWGGSKNHRVAELGRLITRHPHLFSVHLSPTEYRQVPSWWSGLETNWVFRTSIRSEFSSPLQLWPKHKHGQGGAVIRSLNKKLLTYLQLQPEKENMVHFLCPRLLQQLSLLQLGTLRILVCYCLTSTYLVFLDTDTQYSSQRCTCVPVLFIVFWQFHG